MKTIFVDANSRTSVVGCLGVAKNYTANEEIDSEVFCGLVRFYNYGEEDGIIKIKGGNGDGMKIPAGHVEYIGIQKGDVVQVVSGSFNVM